MMIRLLTLLLLLAAPAWSADLPFAAESPIGGFAFDDRPVAVPVSHNFQVALNAASADMNRRCGNVEAYGWRLQANEQDRVNKIFNATADRMKNLGYQLKPQSPKNVARDVTVFSATKAERDLLLMWSAGDLGLVLLMCELQPGTQPSPSRMT
ncbi:MAG: hypothetical protein EB121_08570, partial [Alphaproteobacteria bacterium]|nr:hypothetical protein [Alphaproteobacteria bacterium]